MKKHFNMKNRFFSMIESWYKMPLLLVFVYLTGGNTAMGQSVTVVYEKESSKIIITNNGSDTVVFFPQKQDLGLYDGYGTHAQADTKFDKCGIEVVSGPVSKKPVKVAPNGGRIPISNVKKYAEFVYYTIERGKIVNRKSVLIASDASPAVASSGTSTTTPTTATSTTSTTTPTTTPVATTTTSTTTSTTATAKQTTATTTTTKPTAATTTTTKPSTTTTPSTTAQATPKEKTAVTTYTVKRGETASSIAKKYGVTVTEIQDANNSLIDVDNLKAGQKIKIPLADKSTAAEPSKQRATHDDEVQKTEEVAQTQTEIEDDGKKEPSDISAYATPIAIGVLLLLLLIVIVFYRKKSKNNKGGANKQNQKINYNYAKPKEPERKSSSGGALLIEEEDFLDILPASYNVDMKDIRDDAEGYYKIDMLSMLKDSTVRNVYFNKRAVLDIYKFYSSFLQYEDKTNETGCFLIGRWEYAPHTNQKQYDISIEAVVEPGDDAVYGEYNLNFGAKIGITLNYAIENMCEKTGNEYVHTVWMHSHPGLGLFLSSQDLNVQFQLAHSSHPGRMLAIVIDSNSSDFEMAFFASKQDGTMNNDTDLLRTTSLETLYRWAKTAPKEKTPPPSDSNYFSTDILPPTGKVNRVLFTGATIIGTDMALVHDDMGLRGYFYGTPQGSDVNINEFKEVGKESGAPLGCLLNVHRFSYNEIIKDYSPQINNFEFVAVHAIEDGNIYLLTKDEQNKYPNFKDNVTFISLMKMKEWTRRKR